MIYCGLPQVETSEETMCPDLVCYYKENYNPVHTFAAPPYDFNGLKVGSICSIWPTAEMSLTPPT